MRLGILGAGTIGEKHAAAAASVGIEVVRVVDQNVDRATAVAQVYGSLSDDEPRSLWDDDSLDAVVIAVPNYLHRSMALEAMRSGKDVLLEKPMAMSASECDELVEASDQTRRILQIGYTHRFTAVGTGAKEYIDTGQLGEIYHAKAHLHLRRESLAWGAGLRPRSSPVGH